MKADGPEKEKVKADAPDKEEVKADARDGCGSGGREVVEQVEEAGSQLVGRGERVKAGTRGGCVGGGREVEEAGSQLVGRSWWLGVLEIDYAHRVRLRNQHHLADAP